MRRGLRQTLAVCGVAGTIALGYAAWIASKQGLNAEDWQQYTQAQVRFDPLGIPTINAGNWFQIVEAQGYVVASERLFQMDLMRRMGAGRMAEWAGAGMFLYDVEHQMEGRMETAQRAVANLPSEEREYCEAYATGVNEFITRNPERWGIEYQLLREAPEAWSCADTMLVLLALNEQLTSSSELEISAEAWRRNLSPAWEQFLFTDSHPWNRPLFGAAATPGPMLPPAKDYLARTPLQDDELTPARYQRRPPVGSNNWAWRGTSGAFLANDPHLMHTVPSVWYGMRLRVQRDDWVVGAAVPGVPGILIGMNPKIAWTLTNTGEDVDDLLEERISDDGRHYLAAIDAKGNEDWRPLRFERLSLKVRGEAKPRRVLARFTHRGPLVENHVLKDSAVYSRQWLPLKDGILRLPVYGLADSIEEFDDMMNHMRIPSQNVLVMNREGDVLYRTSGTGILRKTPGHRPLPALEGEWLGFTPMEERPRLYRRADPKAPTILSTANQRIWTEGYGHLWESDDRQDRIAQTLGARGEFTRADMEHLQHDTTSRFRKLLLSWIAQHKTTIDPRAQALASKWQTWDGDAHSEPRAFSFADKAEELLTRILLTRVQQRFAAPDQNVPYRWPLQRAWLTTVLSAPANQGMAPFGLEAEEVANHLLKHLIENDSSIKQHQEINHWRAQHPFYTEIPLLGRIFAVDEYPQWGAEDTINAETPYYGASLRVVWNLAQPWDSTWILPTGQSGHIASKHYKNMQKLWFSGQRMKVFDDGSDWGFGVKTARGGS